jgi:alpha-beta hydrolase superfamily lysophospholipase
MFSKIISAVVLVSLSFACRSTGDSDLQSENEHALKTRFLTLSNGVEVRIGEQLPEGEIKGDVLYLHGFGDRLDNHGPLFQEWNEQGLRVISFDYPSHGETRGPGLDSFNAPKGALAGLGEIAKQVEQNTRQDKSRPLILAGWSTGGLLGIRVLQQLSGITFERRPSAAIFFAPALSMRPTIGRNGIVTEETLSKNPNPPHLGPIKPLSPTKLPLYSADVLANAKLAWKERFPVIPTLILLGDDKEDKYVSSDQVRAWIMQQRAQGNKLIKAMSCTKAMHELDNEPDPVGAEVRRAAALFGESLGTMSLPDFASCKGF